MYLKAIHRNCSGCGTCRLACAIANFNEVRPARALLTIEGRFPHRATTGSICAISAAPPLGGNGAEWMESTALSRSAAPAA